MNISKFNQLLQVKYPRATASVPNTFTLNRKIALDVVFNPGGKVFTYKGYIYQIAERLGLIEVTDMNKIADRVMYALKTKKEVIDLTGASDTIRYHGVDVSMSDAGYDDFGRKLSLYTKE